MSLHIFMAAGCWISSLQGSPGGKAGDGSGVERSGWREGWRGRGREEEAGVVRWVLEWRNGQDGIGGQMGGGARRNERMSGGMAERKQKGEERWMATCGGEAWRMERVVEGITNRSVCCNGWGLIAAEMESTLQVLTECSTSGAGPLKEANNSAALKWCFIFQQMREMCRGGWDWRGRGVLQRDTGLLSIFRVVKNVSKGQHVPGDSFYWTVFVAWPGSPNHQAVIIQATPPNCDGYC